MVVRLLLIAVGAAAVSLPDINFDEGWLFYRGDDSHLVTCANKSFPINMGNQRCVASVQGVCVIFVSALMRSIYCVLL
jgi:hypothetical protein